MKKNITQHSICVFDGKTSHIPDSLLIVVQSFQSINRQREYRRCYYLKSNWTECRIRPCRGVAFAQVHANCCALTSVAAFVHELLSSKSNVYTVNFVFLTALKRRTYAERAAPLNSG